MSFQDNYIPSPFSDFGIAMQKYAKIVWFFAGAFIFAFYCTNKF